MKSQSHMKHRNQQSFSAYSYVSCEILDVRINFPLFEKKIMQAGRACADA